MNYIFFIIFAFVCGAIPFSVWLGKLVLQKDVRFVGDGNPGAINVIKSGSKTLGIIVLILDITKAAIPVGLAYNNYEIRGLPMALIAVAPVIGHAFSPFLLFKGGKAIGTALGSWIGLTIWKAPLAGLIPTLIGFGFVSSSGWAILLGLIGILVLLLFWNPDKILFLVWAVIAMVLIWKHRHDLSKIPKFRPWVSKVIFSLRKH
ncbi:MAG: glycerol-3-phosphate acyltransferase [Anaerolineaceae bacterium]